MERVYLIVNLDEWMALMCVKWTDWKQNVSNIYGCFTMKSWYSLTPKKKSKTYSWTCCEVYLKAWTWDTEIHAWHLPSPMLPAKFRGQICDAVQRNLMNPTECQTEPNYFLMYCNTNIEVNPHTWPISKTLLSSPKHDDYFPKSEPRATREAIVWKVNWPAK